MEINPRQCQKYGNQAGAEKACFNFSDINYFDEKDGCPATGVSFTVKMVDLDKSMKLLKRSNTLSGLILFTIMTDWLNRQLLAQLFA